MPALCGMASAVSWALARAVPRHSPQGRAFGSMGYFVAIRHRCRLQFGHLVSHVFTFTRGFSWGPAVIRPMERRTFLLGLIGSLAATTLAPALAKPAQAQLLAPQTPSEAVEATEGAEVSTSNLDDVRTEYAQYYRRHARRVYRRYVRRPYRRSTRRARRYWRRGRWY